MRFRTRTLFQSRALAVSVHHRAVLDYCKRLNVEIQPFVQLNHNALLHCPMLLTVNCKIHRLIRADFQGQIAELLAKVTEQAKLGEAVSADDKAILLEALRSWGALDKDYAYKASLTSASSRGY